MNIDWLMMGVAGGASVLAAVLLKLYLSLHAKFKHLQKERLDLEYRARQRAVEMVEQARNKAEEIISKATVEAISEKRDVSTDLQRVAQEQQEMYKQMLQNISKDIEGEAVREFQEIKSQLNEQSQKLNIDLADKLKADYQQAQIELENYKKTKLREIKEHLSELMMDISHHLGGELMSVEAHTDLAEKLLVEAKQKYGL